MSTTMRELMTGSLRLINSVQINETPSADDMAVCLSAANAMLDSWSTERLGIYTVQPFYFDVQANKFEYLMGPTGDWIVPRPMNIQQATLSYGGSIVNGSLQNLNTMDFPLESLNDAQYSAIRNKHSTSLYPTKFYDNGNYPNRLIRIWPVPTTSQPITFWLWSPLISIATLDVVLSFPPGYERAIRYNVAREVAPEFGKELAPSVSRIAVQSKGVIKRMNSGAQYILGDFNPTVSTSRTD